MSKVQRLKPAHKIYERLLWDQDCISGANFVIGYEDRFLGIMEATREEFESEEIPFHRIRYFKDVETGQHIWDREKRIDLITRNYVNTFTPENDSSSLSKKPSSLNYSDIHSSSSSSVNKYSDSNKNSKESSYNNNNSWEQQSRTIPVFSTKSKKNYLKRRRKKYRLRELSEARQKTEEEERIEAEHNQMYEDKMREVEERILRFRQFQIVRT